MDNAEYWLGRVNYIFDNNYKRKKIQKWYSDAYRDIEKQVFELYDILKNSGELTTTKLYQYDRFQSLLDNIQRQNKKIQSLLTADVTESLQQAYRDVFQESEQLLGINSPWGIQNDKFLESMMKTKWAGGNYSTRIWRNTNKIAKRIESDIASAIVKGTSHAVVAKQIQKDFGVGFYEADRLVRTELMRAINQGQIDTYKSEGIKKVKWTAADDDRTCGICEKHDGEIFDIDKCPVIYHPNCRCTILPVLRDLEQADKEWQQWLDERNLIEIDGRLIDKTTGEKAKLKLKNQGD